MAFYLRAHLPCYFCICWIKSTRKWSVDFIQSSAKQLCHLIHNCQVWSCIGPGQGQTTHTYKLAEKGSWPPLLHAARKVIGNLHHPRHPPPPSPILAVNQTPTSSPLAALLLGKQHPEKDRKQEIKWASKSQYLFLKMKIILVYVLFM